MIIGTGGGGIDVGERQYQDFFTSGGKHVTPYAIAVGICGMVSSEISISLGLHGISHVLSTGCTSSTDAIGYAAMLLRRGESDVLLSGGTDGCVLPGMIFGFSRMRAVSTHYNDRPDEASRPFDRGRDGFVLGEGAWMVALERESRARARGARIYATIDGYASTCDAYHRVQMDPDGEQIVRCMTGAVERSGRALEEIGYVNYHGTSTQLNDAIESRCTRRVFGRARGTAAGVVDQVDDWSPARRERRRGRRDHRARLVVRLSAADDQPDAITTRTAISTSSPNEGRKARPAAALCNCLGFGSKNSALVLGAAMVLRWLDRGSRWRRGHRPTAMDDDVDRRGGGPAGSRSRHCCWRAPGVHGPRLRSGALPAAQALWRHAESRRVPSAVAAPRRRNRSSRSRVPSTACCSPGRTTSPCAAATATASSGTRSSAACSITG